MALEDRIREARKKSKLTQEQAATMIGVAKSTWAGYESGNSQPDISKLVKIMEVLSVDANYLWQDYFEIEKAPTAMRQEPVSMDATNSLLVALGYIKPGEDLSDGDLAFLTHVIGLLDAWFGAKQK